MSDLNRKVQQRLKKIRRNSDDVFTRLATEYENCTRDQVCVYSGCEWLLIKGVIPNLYRCVLL